MRSYTALAMFVSAVLVASTPAHAGNPYVTGTVTTLVVESNIGGAAESVIFQLSTTPAQTGCPNNGGYFAFDPASISDAQTRKNMLTTLLVARTSGMQLLVSYDGTGAHCNAQFGFAIPLALEL